MFSANEEGSYVHAHTIVLGAPPRADCRRVCAMNLRRRLYSHQPIAVNSLAHCRSNVLTSYESRTLCSFCDGRWRVAAVAFLLAVGTLLVEVTARRRSVLSQ